MRQRRGSTPSLERQASLGSQECLLVIDGRNACQRNKKRIPTKEHWCATEEERECGNNNNNNIGTSQEPEA